jgi:D-alanine-D-alanine ligase
LSPGFRDASEYGLLDEIRVIERVIREVGHDSQIHAASTPAGLAAFLDREQPDVVFNCCESFQGVAALEMSVAALYDLFGVAYTGSPALTLGIALNKGIAKSLFRANGVPTPRHVVMASAADLARPHPLAYPLIVKPIAEDASIGIDARSVVHDNAAMAERVKFVWSEFNQPALVEEFVDGRELNVGLLADSRGEFLALPVSEVPFDALPPGTPAIVSYDAKWITDSLAYKSTPSRCPASLEPALAERVQQTALSAARAVGLRDYGRIDMRLRMGDQALFVLEANPNPDLSDEAGFMRAAVASGRTVAATVLQILSRAVERAGIRP